MDLSVDLTHFIAARAPIGCLRKLAQVNRAWRYGCVLAVEDLAQIGAVSELKGRQVHAYVRAVLFGRDVFITGGAHAGKSYTLDRIIYGLRLLCSVGERSVDELARVREADLHALQRSARALRCVAVTAPSGTVASMRRGCTLRAKFGLSFRGKGSHVARQSMLDSRVLAIDEVNTASATMMDFVSMSIRTARREHADRCGEPSATQWMALSQLPMGGAQLIAAGDWLRLPPTRISEFAFESNAWAEIRPEVIELDLPSHHDEDERRFTRILGEMRFGRLAAEDASWLNRACACAAEQQDAPMALFHDPVDVANRNERMLARVEAPLHLLRARDFLRVERISHLHSTLTDSMLYFDGFPIAYERVIGSLDKPQMMVVAEVLDEDFGGALATDHDINRIAQAVGVDPRSIRPERLWPETVALKEGCRVRCTRNMFERVALVDGDATVPYIELMVADGATGTVLSVDWGGWRVSVNWDDCGVLTVEPQPYSKRFTYDEESDSRGVHKKVATFTRYQLPLEVCYAKTIREAGQDTHTQVGMRLTEPEPPGVVYAALSRVTSLSQLVSIAVDPVAVQAHPKALAFYGPCD